MEALLYHDSMYSTFYASHDPLDNAVPSLHIAIPFGIILLNVLHVRQRGLRIREWEHRRYHYFVVGNTVVFAFTILYLGIHWLTDIPLGMLIGGTGALFIHYLQPRLRNDHGGWFRGVSRAKVNRHIIVEGSIALLLAALLAGATAHQVNTADDRVDYRLGPGDTVHDIVQRFDVGEQVEVSIVNLDSDSPVHIALRIAEEAEPAFEAGYVNWEAIEASGSVITVEPGARVDIIVDQPKVWWLVLMHVDDDANGTVELQVTNHYGEAPMNKAVLLSLPSLWMTGFVLHRIARNRLNGLHWLDPTPSHAWEEA